MNIWSLVKRLSIKELFLLSILMLQKPLLVLPTLRATRRTIVMCNRLYDKKHHGHGRENAFRHALWNLFVSKYVFDINKNLNTAIDWAEKITDLHERISPNPPLEKAMDLHNNKAGRSYFKQIYAFSEKQIIEFLQQKVEKAEVIANVKDVQGKEDSLVCLF